MSLEETLKSIPFFNHLNPDNITELASVGRIETKAEQAVLFAEGEPANSLYVILAGRVQVYTDQDGQHLELSILQKGDFFGELALVDGGIRSATVETLDNSEFFILGRDEFLKLLTKSTRLLSDVLAGISSKIRGANERFFHEMMAKQKLHTEMERERHRALAEMVAGVAHEINTPLGIVNTAASLINESLTPELIARMSVDEECASAMDDIVQAGNLIQGNIARANRLVQTFKSISVHQVTDTKEEVPLWTTINDVIDLFRMNARQANIQIEMVAEPPADEQMWMGYPGYLSQILLNLLTNIERYAYPDGEGGIAKIILRSDHEHQQFILSVQDFGRGMDPEHVSKVFDVFFTTGRDKGGTGLGMSIVHNLMTDAFGGTIHLASQPNAGTTVTLTFPQVIVGD